MSLRRRSNRSLRRYAASTRSLLTCASASSQTSRGVSVLRRPVPEAGPEAVRHGVDVQGAHQVAHGAMGLRHPGRRREHRAGAVGQLRPRRVEHAERPVRQRHPVRAARLHMLGGHGPHAGVEVDVRPARAADLAGAGRGEHQELEGERGAPVGVAAAHLRQRGAHLGVRQRPAVLRGRGVARQRRAERLAGGVVGAVALGDGPLHHRADVRAHPFGGLALGGPDRLQHGSSTAMTSEPVTASTGMRPSRGRA